MRAINFNAGPSSLPLPALEQAQAELLDFGGTGMSIIEHSHRGKAYERVHQEAIELVRELAEVPPSHEILFLQGGASLQFAMLPMNFVGEQKYGAYALTGGWSEKALEEAQRVGPARAIASTRTDDGRYARVPGPGELRRPDDAAYTHMTSNNTLFGTQYHHLDIPGQTPLVADMSSDILSRPIDVSRFALIYAGAQKNLGPSGVVLVIADRQFLESGRKDIPKYFQYRTHAEANSLYNTPPTFSIYLCRNVLQWLKREGGLAAIGERNAQKAHALYSTLDALRGFCHVPAQADSRSQMNVVFRLPNETLEDECVKAAEKAGMMGLKGHRSTGGLRASLYNAVSLSDVGVLCDFLKSFAQAHG